MSGSTTRRGFLQAVAGAAAATAGVLRVHTPRAAETPAAPAGPPAPELRKVILVVFGGGTRSSEAIDDPEHRWIPNLWHRMAPRGTLWTNMRVEHRVVHPNSTGSIKTGHWEWDDIDWSRPPAHPTIFELFRKHRDAPDTAAWSLVYASILNKTGESLARGYGARFAANVVEPPTIPRSAAREMDRRMARAAGGGSAEAGRKAAAECAELARTASRIDTAGLRSGDARRWLEGEYQGWKHARRTTSHDAFLADRAVGCMRRFAPGVMSVDFGEIDCAHYGSWSRYVEAIRRTDALAWRLWQAAAALPEYRDRTLMLILPDHGRELDRPGSGGFLHHSDFYTGQGADEGCRRVWMLALGPGIAAGRRIDRPTPITAAAPTAAEYLDLPISPRAAPSVLQAATA